MTEKREGIIIKGYGGFYFVQGEEAIYTCSLRGRLRKGSRGVLVGDRVLLTVLEEEKGVVEEVFPRTSQLLRPKVANVDTALVVFAAADPEPDWFLVDRLLILIQLAGIEPAICCNKIDLLPKDACDRLEPYKKAGFTVFKASAKEKIGREELIDFLTDRVTVLAGQSGVGKSSILNMLLPSWQLLTGDVSQKLGRGKHTTRYSELLALPKGGWVVDSPGFSLLDLPEDLTQKQLMLCYPEMKRAEPCRFDGCLHHKEPDCGVKELLESKEFDLGRYERYIAFLTELQDREEKY